MSSTNARNESQKYNCSVSIAFRAPEGARPRPSARRPDRRAHTTSDVAWGSHQGRDRRVDTQTRGRRPPRARRRRGALRGPLPREAGRGGRSATWGARRLKTTVRDLLGMTSSVPDFDTANPAFRASQLTDPMRQLLYSTGGPTALTKLALGQRLVAPAVQGLFARVGAALLLVDGLHAPGHGAGLCQNARPLRGGSYVYLLLPSSRSGFVSNGKPPSHARPRHRSDVDDAPLARRTMKMYSKSRASSRAKRRTLWATPRPPPTWRGSTVRNEDLNADHDPWERTRRRRSTGWRPSTRLEYGPEGDWEVAYGHMGATRQVADRLLPVKAAIAVGTSLETDTQQPWDVVLRLQQGRRRRPASRTRAPSLPGRTRRACVCEPSRCGCLCLEPRHPRRDHFDDAGLVGGLGYRCFTAWRGRRRAPQAQASYVAGFQAGSG